MTKLTKLRQFTLRERAILLEATVAMGLARLAIKLLPYKRVEKLLGDRSEKTGETLAKDAARAQEIGKLIERLAPHLPWKSLCLVQALAGRMMLKRRGIPATIYIGVAKDTPKDFESHAWLRSGQTFITGARGHDRYQVITVYR